MDVVGYSIQPMEKQTDMLTGLQSCVQASPEFQQAQARNELICLPTGDGMALVFFGDPVRPVRCSLEVGRAIKAHPELKLRMGIHTGPVCRHAGIKNEINVVGSGINMAQRVMDCGDADHILLSRTSAEVLQQMSGWPECLYDLGTHEVKHGVRIQIYNLCKDEQGNPALPRRIDAGAAASKLPPPTAGRPAGRRSKQWLLLGSALAITFALAAFAAYQRLGPLSKASDASPRAPALTEGPEQTLRYYVIVQKYRNGRPYEGPFQLSGERVFEADYRIRLAISSPETGYLYIVNEGAASTPQAPAFNALFPSPLTNGGSALLSPGREIRIPEGGSFIFDKEKGVEKLWLVWSKESLGELEALKKWANPEDRGAVRDSAQLQALQLFLAKYAAAPPALQQDDQKQISILKGRGGTLVHLVKLAHD